MTGIEAAALAMAATIIGIGAIVILIEARA